MRSKLYLLVAVVMIASMALTACQPAPTAAPAEPAAPVEPTAVPPTAVPPTDVPPTPEPTEVPLGSAEKPIIMAMAPSATAEQLTAGGGAMAAKLEEMTGYKIELTIPNSYAALVEAMGSGNAQIGWLPPLAYMLAKEKGYAEVGLAVIRNGSNHYGVQYVANASAGFTSYFDEATNTTTADAATALAQFEGKKPCWTDPLSASGYVIPSGLIAQNNIKTKSAAFVIGHPTVIQAVYAGGICDFGATYIDARTDKAFAEVPDVLEKVVIIYRTEPYIPNDNVSFAADVPEEVVTKLTDALVEMASTEEGVALLKDIGYQVQGLEKVDDTFYDEFRVSLQASGLDVTTLVK